VAAAREQTPATVEIRHEPRPPVTDPGLGIPVDVASTGVPPNRLVTIGDSITQGYKSAAVFHTDRSWPAIVACELGLRPQADFRYPVYEPPSGPGGLPFDLERAIRGLEQVVGEKLEWHEILRAGRWLQKYMDRIEDYWEGRGDGCFKLTPTTAPYHNLAVYGADLVDVQVLDLTIVEEHLQGGTSDNPFAQGVEHDNDIAWQVVLDSCKSVGPNSTVLDAARAMGEEGSGPHGIETLVVMLGANNALGSVVQLDPHWTPDDYLSDPDLRHRLDRKGAYNVWQPAHFAEEWQRLVAELHTIKARHVIVATVPQVTIAPIAHGWKGKVRQGSRYFPYYTRPWIRDEDFDPDDDPWIDEDQARGIDSAIDAFNETIIASVRDARNAGKDWYVFDLGGLLDSMAVRRYVTDPSAQPPWWKPYDFPPQLAALKPPADTRFFQSGAGGREQGGLFSLDGVHPTTIASGVLAREVARIMDRNAGVSFLDKDGNPRPRGTVDIDFDRVLTLDTLISQPPKSISATLALLGWFDQKLDWVRRITPFGRG
jgi:hypothetical protein